MILIRFRSRGRPAARVVPVLPLVPIHRLLLPRAWGRAAAAPRASFGRRSPVDRNFHARAAAKRRGRAPTPPWQKTPPPRPPASAGGTAPGTGGWRQGPSARGTLQHVKRRGARRTNFLHCLCYHYHLPSPPSLSPPSRPAFRRKTRSAANRIQL